MTVYVVLCTMEGCEECGNEAHIVAVRTRKDDAETIKKAHEWHFLDGKMKHNKHLHPNNVEIEEVEVDGTPDYKDKY